jgi:hypothetical protein
MDIVRAFTDWSVGCDIPINIIGTADDPLFQASQIGKLLGLVNIRESIKDFDDDEKLVVRSADAIGRQQTAGPAGRYSLDPTAGARDCCKIYNETH